MHNLKLKNRIIRSATWEALANSDGSPSMKQISIYEQLAKGGVGMIITGFTGVTMYDPSPVNMMRLCDDKLISRYTRLVDTWIRPTYGKLLNYLQMQQSEQAKLVLSHYGLVCMRINADM